MRNTTTYTTSYGRTIPAKIIQELINDIQKGVDFQRSINDHLCDIIPKHENDLDEATEIYNHAEEIYYDANLSQILAA